MVDHRGSALAQLVAGAVVIALLAGGVWFAVATASPHAPSRSETVALAAPSLSALVPDGVPLVVSVGRLDLVREGPFRDCVFAMPFVPNGGGAAAPLLDHAMAMDSPVSDPLHRLGPSFEGLSLDGDVLGRQVVHASDPQRYLRAPVQGRRVHPDLTIARISTRLADALSQTTVDAIAARLGNNLRVRDLGGGVVRLSRPAGSPMRPRFESPRLWGTGRPGETIGFLWRSEDIVAFALQEHLVREVAALASCPPAELALAALADGAPETPRVGLAAHADLSEAGSLVLQRLVEVGYPLALLRHWLPPGMLEGLGVTLDAESTQVLSGHATIAAEMGRLQPEVRAIYRAPPPPHARIAGRVPARDTIAMLGVTGHAPHVVRALLWEGLDWGQRSALKSRLRRRDAADALEGAALLFGDQWGLALRAAERHGRSPPGVSWALLVETATGVRAEDVGARLLALSEGIGGNVQRRTYRGHELIGLDPAADVPWPSSLPRAFFVASEFSVFASDEVYLERFVDTLVDPEAAPPILRTAGWMDTMAELPQAAHATAFVDLCALLHSPAAPGAEGGRGGLLWELQRNRLRGPAAAREAAIRRLREQLKEARRKLRKAITSFHRGLAEDSVAAIERRLERMEASDSHHPMHALQHLRGLGVTMTATTDALEVELRVHAAPLEER